MFDLFRNRKQKRRALLLSAGVKQSKCVLPDVLAATEREMEALGSAANSILQAPHAIPTIEVTATDGYYNNEMNTIRAPTATPAVAGATILRRVRVVVSSEESCSLSDHSSEDSG